MFVKFGLEEEVARKFYFTQNFFLQQRRVDFFGKCFAVPRKLSRGPQFENHWSNLNGVFVIADDILMSGNGKAMVEAEPDNYRK